MKSKIVLIGLVAVVGFCLVTGLGCTRGMLKDAVSDAAKEYVTELGLEWKGGSASTQDSDGDGYVSIDVRVVGQGDACQIVVKNLECTYSYVGFETGCRERVMMPKGGTQ